jgi:hypothetical protein
VTLILALAYLITLVLILPILVVTFLYWISSGYALRYRIASLLSASATRVGMIPVKSNKG